MNTQDTWSLGGREFTSRFILGSGKYSLELIEAAVRAALEHDTCTIEDFKALLSPAAEPFLEEMAQRACLETKKHFGNTVYLFTPLYIANYCENYCVYCGFNCYNHIHRMKLSMKQIEHEMEIIAQSGMEEILLLTGESRSMSSVEYPCLLYTSDAADE